MCFCRDGQQTELSCNIFCVSPVEIYMLGFHLLLRDLSLCCFIREDFYSSQLFKFVSSSSAVLLWIYRADSEEENPAPFQAMPRPTHTEATPHSLSHTQSTETPRAP